MGSYSTLSSEDLVKACVGSNNSAAWAEFLRRFQPTIAKVVLRRARRWEEPPRHLLDDLIQETYLKLCGDNCALLARFEPRHPNSIFGFLKVVAACVVHDHYKSERARKRDSNQTEALTEQESFNRPGKGNGSFDSIEKQIQLREIREALLKLSKSEHAARNQAIFWLHHREGLTARAIASIPGIGLNTKGVETLLRRMTHMIQGHMGTDR